MMKKINYIFNLIPNKKHNLIIDVGCDHGYLSLLLIKHDKSEYVLNIDNKKKPLLNAIKNTNLHNYNNRIFNILNEGLLSLPNELNPDYIVIAGIGTNNIINILNNENIGFLQTKFILQSEGNIDQLKKYLTKKNFFILEEKEVFIKKKIFNFIICRKGQ